MAEAVDHGGSTTKCDDQCRNRGGSRSLKQRRKKRKKESLPWLGCASDLAMTQCEMARLRRASSSEVSASPGWPACQKIKGGLVVRAGEKREVEFKNFFYVCFVLPGRFGCFLSKRLNYLPISTQLIPRLPFICFRLSFPVLDMNLFKFKSNQF